MKMKKVILALATIFAMTACGPAEPSKSESSSNQESQPSTSEPISTSEAETVEDFLANIYGENVKYGKIVNVTNNAYPNIKGYYVVNDNNNKLIGHVFILEGKNSFGAIKMSIGINADTTIGKVFLIENGQTNGKDKIVQTEYVDKYNKGDITFDDVKCGATVGATLINEMGKQALSYVKAEINHEITDFTPYCKEIFGLEKVEYIRRNNVIDSTNATLKEFWTVKDSETNKTLGRVYHAEVNKNHYMIGINKGGEYGEEDPSKPQTFKKLFWVNPTSDELGKAASEFISKLNADPEANLKENASDAALIKDIKTAVNQAFAHAKLNKITNPVNIDHLVVKTFGKDVSYCENTMVDDPNYPNVLEYWNVKDANRKYIGRVYHMEAPGEHGALHVAVAIKINESGMGDFYHLATDARTPDPTSNTGLQNYINGLNDGTIDLNSADDVKCGATGTANGIRFLALNAVKHYGAYIIADVHLTKVFGNQVSYIDHKVLNNDHVREYWNVMGAENKYLGRVYHCAITGEHATIHTMVGLNANGQFVKMELINRAPGQYGDIVVDYVNKLNNGTVSLNDDITNGATASSTAIRDIAKEALAHFKANPILPLLKDLSAVQVLFDNTVTFNDHRLVSDDAFANVVEYWTVKDENGATIAGAYHCALPGEHAVMEITVSVYPVTVNYKTTAKLGKVNLMNRAPGQYGDILADYVDKLNKGELDIHDDIHNGATASSEGVKSMVLQAMNHLQNYSLDKGMPLTQALSKTFGETAKYGEASKISNLAFDNLLESWDVTSDKDAKLGRVYHGAFPGTHGVLHALIAVNLDGSLKTIYWANCPVGIPGIPENVAHYGELAQNWINKINSGEIKLTDDVHSGASATTSGIISLALQALDHYTLNPIA